MEKKIAFFDIDGTLTSEIDRTIPISAIKAIRKARENGHLMFINTGRCFQNVEKRFIDIGFDGFVCGCGTDIVVHDNDEPDGFRHLMHEPRDPEVMHKILMAARAVNLDILFESRYFVSFDNKRPLHHSGALRQHRHFSARNYFLRSDVDAPDFTADKFVVWFDNESQLEHLRKTSDQYFDCIDRGGQFREFVPLGYSKATGIEYLLKHFGLSLDNAYCFGDSNNDLPMLEYVPNSVVMGNAEDESLKHRFKYVTDNASCDGIANALLELGFIS